MEDVENSLSAGKFYADLNYVNLENQSRKVETTIIDLSKTADFELREMTKAFQSIDVIPTVDLGEVNFTFKITGSAKPIDANMLQVYMRRNYKNPDGTAAVKWDLIEAKDKDGNYIKFSIFPNDIQNYSFTINPEIGFYDRFRFIFFGVGWTILADQMAASGSFEVVTKQIRVKKPFIEVDYTKVQNPSADGKLRIPFIIKFPANTWTADGGWWAMAKGGGNGVSIYKQPWIKYATKVNGVVTPTANTKVADGPDNYWYNESEFVIDYPEINGLFNIQFGLFDNTWKEAYNWIWPGFDFEVGGDSWVTVCPTDKLPPRLRVKNGQFVRLDGRPFNFYEGTKGGDAIKAVRGGNWGNAYGWTKTPALNKSGFFGSLNYMGLKWCRFLFNPDWYTEDITYRHRVRDSIGKILVGGLYPLVGPHNLHTKFDSIAERNQKFLELCEMIANDWKGMPIMYAIASEPKELVGGWAECKPLWEEAARRIRAIDPDAFIIVPTKGYSKTDTTDEANNLIDPNLVDAYSWHPYVRADNIYAWLRPLLDKNVGVIIEEYGCGSIEWQRSINVEMQKLSKIYPNLLAFAQWAYTSKGQDSCYMVEDGSVANLVLTDAGNMHKSCIQKWDNGELISETTIVVPPPDGGSGGTGATNPGTGTGTGNTIDLSNYYTKPEVDQKFANLPKIYNADEIQAMIDASIGTGGTIDPNLIKNIVDQELAENRLLTPEFEYRVAGIVNSFGYTTVPQVEAMIQAAIGSGTGGVTFDEMKTYVNSVLNLKLLTLSAAPATVSSGLDTTGSVKLTGLAPKGGVLVSVVSNNPNIIVPSTVNVEENSDTATFLIKTNPVNAKVVGTVTATNGGISKAVNITINPPTITSLTFNPSPTNAGRLTTGTLRLNGFTPSNSNPINITTSVPVNGFPMTLPLQSNVNEAQFSFTPTTGGNVTVTFTASLNAVNRTASLRIV